MLEPKINTIIKKHRAFKESTLEELLAVDLHFTVPSRIMTLIVLSDIIIGIEFQDHENYNTLSSKASVSSKAFIVPEILRN